MFCELTVIIKDEEKTLRKKFPVYEKITVDHEDPIIKNCIDEVLANFNGAPENVKINIQMVVQ